MLSIIAVLAIVSAAVLLVTYLKRQNKDSVIPSQSNALPPPNLRSLFAPTDRENLAFEHEKRASAEAEAEKLRLEKTGEQKAEINLLISEWRESPDRRNTIQLLHLAANTGDVEIFSQTAFEIIGAFRDGKLDGFSDGDLASLLDSHYRLLPAGSQSAGELFWLREEISNLT